MASPPQALVLTTIRVRIAPFLRPAVGYRTDAAIASGLLVPAFLGPSELIHDNRLHPGQQALTSIWKQNPEPERSQEQVIEMTNRFVARRPGQLRPQIRRPRDKLE